MIALASATDSALPPGAPDGFGWWYADLMDEAGDGAVLIWGFAMPFFRRERPGAAEDFPFLNLAIYQGGACTFYHLQDLRPDEIARTETGWRFGRSTLSSHRTGDRWALRADLELPVPGDTNPVHARLTLDGAATWGGPAEAGPHRWAPLACGPAAVEVHQGDQALATIAGRGYHDRNDSDVPLGTLGIREWAWGRLARPDHDLVHYVCWPDGNGPARSLALRIGADGRLDVQEDAVLGERGRVAPLLGFGTPAALDLADPRGPTVAAELGPIVDRSPFYLRFPLASADGRGFGERVRPGAVDQPWMRPFVDMARLRPGHPHWLNPWFLGPRDGRWARTARGLWP